MNSDSISLALENFACSHAAKASFTALGSGTESRSLSQPKEPIVRETKWPPHSILEVLDRGGRGTVEPRMNDARTEVTKAE